MLNIAFFLIILWWRQIKKIPHLEGLILHDKKIILLDEEQGIMESRYTIIHELLHGKHYLEGNLKKNKEPRIIAETQLTYEKLYGKIN